MRIRDLSRITAAFVLPLTLAACAGGEDAAESAEEAAPAADQTVMLPELTADGVWAYLNESQYESWDRWPGTTDMYEGREPHGAQLTTYVNALAAEALAAGETDMPVGAIVVKNNYMNGNLMAVTAMVKTEDFNPDHHNWWFLKRNADGSVDAAGRGTGCESCHQAMSAMDYLFNERPAAEGQ